MKGPSSRQKLPGWAWVLIVLGALQGLLVLAMAVVFLWPWVVAFG